MVLAFATGYNISFGFGFDICEIIGFIIELYEIIVQFKTVRRD